MSGNKDMRDLHVAMYPWFALGHLTSFLHLANKLAERGHKVSFFLPTKTQLKVASHNHHPHLITFIPITVPRVDGLPIGAETTNDVPGPARAHIMSAMDLTQETIEAHLTRLKPDFIFYDFTQWLPGLARKHGIKSVLYATSYSVSISYFSLAARNLPSNHHFSEADLVGPPSGFPSRVIGLQAREARSVADTYNMEFGGGLTLMERNSISLEECDAIGVKTCREMEGHYCKFLEKHLHKPVLLAGPVVPKPPASELDEKLDSWLNGFGNGSVIYCALGSEWVLEKDQFQELLLGLELTGRPFFAALRAPPGCETMESALPKGFANRTEGRGIVDGGWVQQQLMLQHTSVGCFVTHCGAGSLSESIVTNCQIVMMPQAMDEFVNARMMSLELRVGVEVEKRDDEDGLFFTREAICKSVGMVMEEESEIGREVRVNHSKWRDFLLSEGVEGSYVGSFIKNLQCLLG